MRLLPLRRSSHGAASRVSCRFQERDGSGWASAAAWPSPAGGRATCCSTAVAVSFVLTQLLKATFRRPRPSDRRVTFASDRFAFPSGHAVRVGAIACSLSLSDPAQGHLWLLWALLVALARVARARHYLFDVFGGLLLGALLGTASAGARKPLTVRQTCPIVA